MNKPELHVFNVLFTDQFQLVERTLQNQILQSVGLVCVPELESIVLNHTVDELVELSIGMSRLNSNTQREGIVFRPENEVTVPELNGRLSFKAINPKFLLKFDE